MVARENQYFQAAELLPSLLDELRDEPMSADALFILVDGVVCKGDQLKFWQKLGKSLAYEDRCELFRSDRLGRMSADWVGSRTSIQDAAA